MRLMMVLILALIVSSCQATFYGPVGPDLQMSPQDIGQLDSEEGLVVGSVRVSASGYSQFHFAVAKKHSDFHFWGRHDRTLSLEPTFGEQVFVTKLPAGMYRFRGWTTGIPDDDCLYLKGAAAVDFTVQPGEVLYIGSWTLRMPPRRITISSASLSSPYSIEVADRREEDLAWAARTHGSLIAKASVELMKPSAERIFNATHYCSEGGGGNC